MNRTEQLKELLEEVIQSLNMTQYDIENPEAAYKVEKLADFYYDKMIDILNHS